MTAAERAGPVDRALNLFTEVRAGESPTALLLGFNVFLLLASYYVIKSGSRGASSSPSRAPR